MTTLTAAARAPLSCGAASWRLPVLAGPACRSWRSDLDELAAGGGATTVFRPEK
ncbi:hypothetical protein [Mycobacterium sp. 48b]|uniref:hypothetical protein n=1 Tax=Mycobacterium sp. 48b TaxID=3400426 RepID=UPI003AB04E0B